MINKKDYTVINNKIKKISDLKIGDVICRSMSNNSTNYTVAKFLNKEKTEFKVYHGDNKILQICGDLNEIRFLKDRFIILRKLKYFKTINYKFLAHL